jgi:hypothetical protein
VEDGSHRVLLQQAPHRRRVADTGVDDHAAGIERTAVVGGHDDPRTRVEQAPGEPRTDEPLRAGHQHRRAGVATLGTHAAGD